MRPMRSPSSTVREMLRKSGVAPNCLVTDWRLRIGGIDYRINGVVFGSIRGWMGFVVSQVSESRHGAPLVRGQFALEKQLQEQPQVLRLRSGSGRSGRQIWGRVE